MRYPVEDVEASRGDFLPRLKTMNTGVDAPISETYFEALMYFGGKDVYYGNLANPSNLGSAMDPGDNEYMVQVISKTWSR